MRANPVVVPATDAHAIAMAPNLRMVDCKEIRADEDPLDIIRESLGKASHAWTWLVEGAPVCMWGIEPKSVMGGTAWAWFYSTEALTRCDKRTFLLGSRAMLGVLLSIYPHIEGFVDARFVASVRWIRKMGFRVGDPFEYGNVPFRHFVKER